MTYVERELGNLKIKTLNYELPIWLDSSFSLSQESDQRLDNNYWSASYYSALKILKVLEDKDIVEIKLFGELYKDKSTGIDPTQDSDIPLIEGNHIRPNVVYPLFEKFTSIPEQSPYRLHENDILLTKDGMPSAYAYVSKSLVDTLMQEFQYQRIAFATHVYRIRLKEEFKNYAAYIVQVMNSRLGQALTRRFVSGSVTPTLRGDDVNNIIIPLPRQNQDEILSKSKKQIEALQLHVMEIMKNVKPSNDLTSMFYKLGELSEPRIPKLPQNWSGGGTRDLHGYYKDHDL